MLEKSSTAKRILHLSDLHFGRINEPALQALRRTVLEQQRGLDLIIVTGDWTQRARVSQFAEAIDFVKTLSCPVLSVPGNHDVPLYNFGRRFFTPYSRYKKLAKLTQDEFHDDLISVVGLSTVNPFRAAAGVVREVDVTRASIAFAEGARNALRILACHHPVFDPRKEEWIRPEVRARRLMDLAPDLILSGHSHLQWVQPVEYAGQKVLHISAGTSVSSRLREEVNSFHILELRRDNSLNPPFAEDRGIELMVKTYDLRGEGFLERGLSTEIFKF